LASAPDIGWFMALRIAQGLCMSTAFTLTMAYLAEQSGADDAASALAPYVTGNVMSNLVGRVMAAAVTDSSVCAEISMRLRRSTSPARRSSILA
jgi:YNFM family putative membrane transporter